MNHYTPPGWPERPGGQDFGYLYEPIIRASGTPGWQVDPKFLTPLRIPVRATDAAPARSRDATWRRRMHAALDRMDPREASALLSQAGFLDEGVLGGIEKTAGEGLQAASEGARVGSEAAEAGLGLLGDENLLMPDSDDPDDDDNDVKVARMAGPLIAAEKDDDPDDDDDEKTAAELAPLAIMAADARMNAVYAARLAGRPIAVPPKPCTDDRPLSLSAHARPKKNRVAAFDSDQPLSLQAQLERQICGHYYRGRQ